MTPTPELREEVARAIWDSVCIEPWSDAEFHERLEASTMADAAIAVLQQGATMKYPEQIYHERIKVLEAALTDCNRLLAQAWEDKAKLETMWMETLSRTLTGKPE